MQNIPLISLWQTDRIDRQALTCNMTAMMHNIMNVCPQAANISQEDILYIGNAVAEFFIIGERFVVITVGSWKQLLKCALSCQLWMTSRLLLKDPLVITKQPKLYFNNSSRIPTLNSDRCKKMHVQYITILLGIGKNLEKKRTEL
jgi:hypothetical protein